MSFFNASLPGFPGSYSGATTGFFRTLEVEKRITIGTSTITGELISDYVQTNNIYSDSSIRITTITGEGIQIGPLDARLVIRSNYVSPLVGNPTNTNCGRISARWNYGFFNILDVSGVYNKSINNLTQTSIDISNIQIPGSVNLYRTYLEGPISGPTNGDYIFYVVGANKEFRIRRSDGGIVLAPNTIIQAGSGVGSSALFFKNRTYLNGENRAEKFVIQNASGVTGLRFDSAGNTLYLQNPIQYTSSSKNKKDVEPCSLGLDFIDKLEPKQYKFIQGTSGRTHYGLISQEVEQVIADLGISSQDFAGFAKEQILDENEQPVEGEYNYYLAYTEFIAPLIKAVQELSAQNRALKQRIEALENS